MSLLLCEATSLAQKKGKGEEDEIPLTRPPIERKADQQCTPLLKQPFSSYNRRDKYRTNTMEADTRLENLYYISKGCYNLPRGEGKHVLPEHQSWAKFIIEGAAFPSRFTINLLLIFRATSTGGGSDGFAAPGSRSYAVPQRTQDSVIAQLR